MISVYTSAGNVTVNRCLRYCINLTIIPFTQQLLSNYSMSLTMLAAQSSGPSFQQLIVWRKKGKQGNRQLQQSVKSTEYEIHKTPKSV